MLDHVGDLLLMGAIDPHHFLSNDFEYANRSELGVGVFKCKVDIAVSGCKVVSFNIFRDLPLDTNQANLVVLGVVLEESN